jgi:hypothetical protein
MRQKMSERKGEIFNGGASTYSSVTRDGSMASLERDGLIVSTNIKFLNGNMKTTLSCFEIRRLQSLSLILIWIYKLKYIFWRMPRRRRPGGVTRRGIGLKL